MRIRHSNVFVDLNPYVLITVAIKYVEKQVQLVESCLHQSLVKYLC